MSIAGEGRGLTKEIVPENIPKEFDPYPHWHCWHGKWNRAKSKLNKVPKTTEGKAASSTDESTWTTLSNAVAAVGTRGLDGIGFAGLGRTPFSGIDIDKCIDPDTGEISPYAMKIVRELDSYTEVTPSREGLRIWVEAEKIPGSWCGSKNNERELEVYSQGRFFTVTGWHLEGTPRTIEKRQEAFDAFMQREAPPDKPKPERKPYTGPGDYVLSLDQFLDEFGVTILRSVNDASSDRAYGIICPWAHEHTGGDISGTRVGQYPSGALWFKCEHAHCDGRRWEHFREQVDPEAYRTASITIGGKKISEESAPPPTTSKSRFERIDLGEPIESGMEPAEMLVPDVLYAGSVHGIYSAGGKGKTFFALWLIKQVIDQDQPVMLLDQENGVRIVSERLRALGVSAEQARRNLHYYPFPSMPLEAGASVEFEELLDEVKPALVVLDSWINFLASAGLDENSSVDIAQWADAYSQKARQRGMAILLLDHIPKEGNTARGSGRKLDYVDVMWELTKPQDFDRETVGRIDLRLKKDREGWMPWGVAFTVGGKDGDLVFGRTAFDSSLLATDNLLPSDRTTLDALKSFGSSGARDKDWREEATINKGLGRTTYYRSRGTLLEQGLVEEVMGKYFYKAPAKQKSPLVPQESHGTSGTTANGGESQESHHPKGWDHGTNLAGTPHRDPEAWKERY